MILQKIRSTVHRVVKDATGVPCYGGRILNYEVREMPFCDIRFTLDQLQERKNLFDEREVTCAISMAFKPIIDTELESIQKSQTLFDAMAMDDELSQLVSEVLHEKTQFLGGMEGSFEVGHLIDTYKIRYCRPYPELPPEPVPTDISANGENL